MLLLQINYVAAAVGFDDVDDVVLFWSRVQHFDIRNADGCRSHSVAAKVAVLFTTTTVSSILPLAKASRKLVQNTLSGKAR